MIDRRCATADDVARWVKAVRDSGPGGQSGPGGPDDRSATTTSTRVAPSTPSTPPTYAELAANAALVLIAVACSLLDRQLAALATAFEAEGGFTERLYRVRTSNRRTQRRPSDSPSS